MMTISHEVPMTNLAGSDPAPVRSDRPRRGIGARDLAIAGVLGGAAILALSNAWRDIFRLGIRDEELSYVLLAPIMIAWLAWVRRDKLGACRLRGGWVGIAILALGWMLYWYGFLADPVLWRTGAVVIAVGAFVSATGSDVLFKFAPVFAACIFLVPISADGRYNLAGPLQTVTARATQTICDLLGMYVDRSGNLLAINGVDVTVAEACNGLRMVMTLLMVCYVVAFSTRVGAVSRIVLLAISPLVAIVANVLRLVPTVWMFGNSSADHAETFHDISGWVMTLLAFLLLMGLFQLLQRTAGSRRRMRAGVLA